MDTKATRNRFASALCLLLPLCGVAGCSYDYPEPVDTVATSPAAVRTPTVDPLPEKASLRAYNDLQLLEREARNYAELDRLLASPGRVILSEVGPLDGPLRGFGKFETVPEAREYTVTAACVGASGAKVFFGQEFPGAAFRPVELALDCARATSQVIPLQQGYIFAHLFLPGPGDTPWTGAVGGVRVRAAA